MARNAPSAAQLAVLDLLARAFCRQASFERQAAVHPSVKYLSPETITAFWTDYDTYKRQASIVKRDSAASAKRLTAQSTFEAKSEELVTDTLPTPITPTNRRDGLSFSAFPVPSSLEPVAPRFLEYTPQSPVSPSEGRSHTPRWGQASGEFEPLHLFPTCLTIGNISWRLFDPAMELLGAELECGGGGAIAIDVMTSMTIERMRIPISSLAAITLDSCSAILTLSRPPTFYKRPRCHPEKAWQLSHDPSPHGVAASAVHFVLGLTLSQHTPDFVNHPLLATTLIIVLPKLKTGDPNKLAFPPHQLASAPLLFIDQLPRPSNPPPIFGVGAQSVSTAVPPFPIARREPSKPKISYTSQSTFRADPTNMTTILEPKPVIAESKPLAFAVKEEEMEAVCSASIAQDFADWFNATSARLDNLESDFGGKDWASDQLGAEQQACLAW